LRDGSSSCILFLFEVVEYLLAFFFILVGEKQSAMSLEVLRNPIGIGFIGVLLICSESDSDNFILPH
jgi:hypothetical protein